MSLESISKKINNRLKNAEKAYAFIIAKQKDDLKKQINLKKQLEVLAEEKQEVLGEIDKDMHPKEWEEVHKELKEILTAIAMYDNNITKLQLNLIEEGMDDKSNFE